MEELIKKLSNEQKNELANLLSKADEILESVNDGFDDDYHSTQFYDGLYDIMCRLGRWC